MVWGFATTFLQSTSQDFLFQKHPWAPPHPSKIGTSAPVENLVGSITDFPQQRAPLHLHPFRRSPELQQPPQRFIRSPTWTHTLSDKSRSGDTSKKKTVTLSRGSGYCSSNRGARCQRQLPGLCSENFILRHNLYWLSGFGFLGFWVSGFLTA